MNIVKELRKRAGIQQKELAIIAGVSAATVSDWETQKKDPVGDRLQKLSEYFGVDPLVIYGVMSPDGHMEQSGAPKTPQARILARGIDQMPERDREKALNMIMLMFEKYAPYFEEEKNDGN